MPLFASIAVVALVLSGVAAASAYSTYGHRFPSLVVDSYGHYSLVLLPSWGEPEPKLMPSDRLVELGTDPLEAPRPAQRQQVMNRLLDTLDPPPKKITLVFQGPQGRKWLEQPLRTFAIDEVLLFFVIYALAAWLVLWSGALVFALCSRLIAGRIYAAWSVTTFVFLLTFYDYNTRSWLTPLFSLSSVALPVSALWLAYGFPEPPRLYRELLRNALMALTGLAGAAALWLASGPILGGDAHVVRQLVDVGIGPSIAALGISVIARVRGSTGRDREELLIAIWGLALAPLLIGCAAVVRRLTNQDLVTVALPFFTLLFPLSIGYSMIRNNILATSAVLTPRMLLVPLVISGLIVAVLGGLGVDWTLRSGGGRPLVPVLVGMGCFILVFAFTRWVVLRSFFRASLQFRPTVERLTDQFAVLREGGEVKQAVHAAVVQWLPALEARVLSLESVPEVAHLPPDHLERLSRGERVWTQETPWTRSLLIPMRSLGELHGVLCVGPKRGAALYTQEDLALLETVAGLGGLALHHARTLEELERLRSLEWEVLGGEKQQVLAALGAEICHEVVYPLNFIKDLLREAARAAPLTPEDVELGREEIGRLERMISSLRTLDPPVPELEPTAIAVPIERAVHLIRDLVRQKQIAVTMDVPTDLKLPAHADLIVQLFVNLLRNAAQAVRAGGAIGVRSFERSGERLIEVWDDGSGIPESVAGNLFTRRITTKGSGHGIGLAVAYRIARSFRWNLSFEREANHTCFRVVIPADFPLPSRERA